MDEWAIATWFQAENSPLGDIAPKLPLLSVNQERVLQVDWEEAINKLTGVSSDIRLRDSAASGQRPDRPS